MVVQGTTRSRYSFRFRGRSFMAFVLTPEPPLAEWLAALDGQIARSAGFFVGRPVVLDLAGMALTKADIAGLIAELTSRDVRIMGVEGADPECLGPGLPPLLKGGRPAGALVETPDGADSTPSAPPAAAAPKQAPFLLLDSPVRSAGRSRAPDPTAVIIAPRSGSRPPSGRDAPHWLQADAVRARARRGPESIASRMPQPFVRPSLRTRCTHAA